MTKNEYIRKAMSLRISKKEWREAVEKALRAGCVDWKRAENFLEVYPLAAAIMQSRLDWYLNGSTNKAVRRKTRREMKNIRCFI